MGVLCVRVGELAEIPKRGWKRKEGGGNKNFKKWGQAGLRRGCLKKRGAGNPLRTIGCHVYKETTLFYVELVDELKVELNTNSSLNCNRYTYLKIIVYLITQILSVHKSTRIYVTQR